MDSPRQRSDGTAKSAKKVELAEHKSHGDGFAEAQAQDKGAKAFDSPTDSRKGRPMKATATSQGVKAVPADKETDQPAAKVARTATSKDVTSECRGTAKAGAEPQEVSSSPAAAAASSSVKSNRNSGEKEQGKGHDKYCHFCQHVKINMLACSTSGCTHRYCIYCLGVHLGDDTEPSTSNAWTDGAWTCPTCRSVCCCSSGECSRSHRHCKAFRYRQRRADAANLRATAAHALVSLAALVGGGDVASGEHAAAPAKEKVKASSAKPGKQPSKKASVRESHSELSGALGESIMATCVRAAAVCIRVRRSP
jgi:hypothetical protein